MPLQPKDLWVPFASVLGTFMGSFLNVCIYRLPRENLHIFRPAWSRCTFCLTTIRWFDNIPILSWLLLRGRCRDCKSPIGTRYPIVEGLTGALLGITAWLVLERHPGLSPGEQVALFAVQAWLVCCLLVSTFIDIDLRIIPDEITVTGMILAPLAGFALPFLYGELPSPGDHSVSAAFFARFPEFHAFLSDHEHMRGLFSSLIGMAVGGGSVHAVGVVGRILFRKEAMGFGDVKYMAFLGGFLGWKGILVAFVLAAVAGAVCGIFAFLLTRDRTMAFGPYLSLGAMVMTLVPEQAEETYLGLIRRVGDALTHWLKSR